MATGQMHFLRFLQDTKSDGSTIINLKKVEERKQRENVLRKVKYAKKRNRRKRSKSTQNVIKVEVLRQVND